MKDITWIMLSNIVLWLGLGGYVVFLAKKQQYLEKSLAVKEHLDNV